MDTREDDELKAIFARNLNAMLVRHDKSQIEVADALGIKQPTFSSWCTGTRMPRMDKVQRLAKYFGIQKSDLIEEKPPDAKKDTPAEVSEEDIMFALFDGDVDEITDEMYAEVKDYARFVKEKQKRKTDGDR